MKIFLSGGISVRKYVLLLFVLLLLTGCAREETLETVSDEYVQPAAAQPKRISVELPDDVVAPVMESTSEQVYLCDGYEIVIETRNGGDFNDTVQTICGYDKDDLTILTTREGEADRHEFVWASAGEEGERIGRAVILDDGDYHYCMSILRDADTTEDSQIVWNHVFSSFHLV